MLNILKYYILDILPYLLIAALVIVIVRYYNCKKSNEFSVKYEVLVFIFYIYITALALKTIVPKDFLRLNINLSVFHLPDFNPYFHPEQPFVYIRYLLKTKNYLLFFDLYVINVFLLTPFGFLFPFIYPKHKTKTIPLGVLISVLIEITQLFIDRVSDIFDISLNIISVVLGYGIYLIINKIIRSKA